MPPRDVAAEWPVGESETARLIRRHDWAATPLGPTTSWPERLRVLVETILSVPQAMWIGWGPELVQIYNDGYRALLDAERHGAGLGRPSAETWADTWSVAGPALSGILAGGPAVFQADRREAYRHEGEIRERFFSYSFSPIPDPGAANGVGGVLCLAVETTPAVLLRAGQERDSLLLRLSDALRLIEDPVEVQTAAARLLGQHLGASRVAYAEDAGDGETVILTSNYTDGVPGLEGRYRYADYGEDLIRDLRAGQASVRSDIASDPRLSEAEKTSHAALRVGAALNVPLVKGGRLVAILGVHYTAAHAFSPEEVSLAQEVAERTWEAVERARAEAALRESEARFRLMADAVPQIVWITDAEARIEFFNRQWADYTGESVLPPTAAYVAEHHIHPEDAGPTMAAFQEAQRTGGPFQIEHRIRSRDGSYRWFLVRAEPSRDPQSGRILKWFGTSTDLHDRKGAEAALSRLNETLESRVAEALAERKLMADVFEGTDAMISVADRDLRLLAFNRPYADEVERLGGRRPRVGDRIPDLYADHPDLAAPVVANWERALGGEVFTLAEEHGDPSRYRRSYERRFEPIYDRDGHRMGAYQYATDVTDRLRDQRRAEEAEAARREMDALYRAYFQSSPDALFVIKAEPDGTFTVEQINPAHQAGVGLRLEDIRGKRIEEVLPPDSADRVIETYRHVVQTGEIFQYRDVFDIGGQPLHWDTTLVPVRDSDGRVARVIGSSRNVTRQVVAEETLRQSQKMEAMGQLTGGVAHDFNNLLTPILGSLDRLQRRRLGDERDQRLIDGALQSAERARTLVQRLLAFARRQPLQPTAVNVGEVVQGMADLVASTTGPQIKVALEIEPGLPAASADVNQLEMAILNLAVNARDAMPEGGTLRISATSEAAGPERPSGSEQPGRYICLSVADTGIGMDEATLARAVEPFFSTKGIGRGTGLGLSMVHGLAAQLGGALSIRSRPGLGTNVELRLPIAAADAPASATPPRPAESKPMERTKGTVLVVDDEELVRATAADMLGELGYTVVEAGSADEALRHIDGGLVPDLVVTDHLMPGLTGTELARILQSRHPDLPILIASGYADVEGIAPDLPRIAKPFRRDELAASLQGLRS
jgi:PAS domain S-box-containing protein